MRIVVHSTAIQDRDGAGLVLDKIRRRFPWLELIWADGGYNAWQVDAAVAKVPVLRMEIVKRSDDMKGFVVLPRRWVVERTFSWFGRNRPACQGFREPRRNPRHLRHPRIYPARPQAACTGVGPDLNNAGRDDGAGPAAGGERLLSNRPADLRRASSSDADVSKAAVRRCGRVSGALPGTGHSLHASISRMTGYLCSAVC
jgi:transposase